MAAKALDTFVILKEVKNPRVRSTSSVALDS